MPYQAKKLPPPRSARPPRRSTTERGYGHAHDKLRRQLLAEHPICQLCQANWSTDLHHIDHNPHNRDRSNCLMVCETCHHKHLHGKR